MRKILLLVVPFVLFAMSCSDDDLDLTPPTITFTSLQPAPQSLEVCGVLEDSVFVLCGGELLAFEVIMRDDVSLSQYKIDIHQNFDCHGHGGGAAPGGAIPNLPGNTTDWAYLSIENLTGQEEVISWQLAAPENVTAGFYHFQVQVLDEAGNDSPNANFYSLRLLNPRDTLAPELLLTQPSESSFSIARGSKIEFAGQLTDDQPLGEGGNGVVFVSYTDLSTSNTFLTPAVERLGAGTGTSVSFNFEVTVPLTLKAGAYRYTIWAFDGVRNIASPRHYEVNVTL
jgi:hypothetical protein